MTAQGVAGPPRVSWVDAAKAISICLVVLIHSGDWLTDAGLDRGPVLATIDLHAESLRMPLFFAASGMFARRWLAASWRDLLNRRLATLIWVFLLWQVVMVAYKYLAAVALPAQRDGALGAQLERAVLAPVRPNAELWFLWALVVFFLLARAMHRWPPRLALAAAALVSLLWSGAVLTTVAVPGSELARVLGSGWVKAPMLFVFFLLGAQAGPAILAAAARLRPWQAVLGVLPWLLAGVLVARFGLYGTFGATFVHQVLGVVAGGCLALLLIRVPVVGRGFAALGRRTLPVYLVHSTVAVLVAVGLDRLGLVAALQPCGPAVVLGTGALGVAAGLVLHRYADGTAVLRAPSWFRPAGASRPPGAVPQGLPSSPLSPGATRPDPARSPE